MNKYRAADILQLEIARYFEHTFGASYVAVGDLPRYDIQFADKTTVEIKLDTTTARTGNCCIEFWNLRKNQQSGILQTEARLWIHVVPEGDGLRCYEMDAKRLLRLCMETDGFKTGGEKGASVFKLVPLEKIQEISNSDFLLDGDIIRFILKN